jgi:hypothetical protein
MGTGWPGSNFDNKKQVFRLDIPKFFFIFADKIEYIDQVDVTNKQFKYV